MLSLEQIKTWYPAHLHSYSAFLLREYLQCRILASIYAGKMGSRLVFMGGTCLRLVHDSQRFSEDINFDNLGLDESQFEEMGRQLKADLEAEGYEVEIGFVHRKAMHCKVRFPGLLFHEVLSGYRTQKVLISLDAEPQQYDYLLETFLLNRFDVFASVRTVPPTVLLAQKCLAILDRKRNKGRDFYDVTYLLSKNVQPDFGYLSAKAGIANREDLAEALLSKVRSLDMEEMAHDAEAFLFNRTDRARITQFEPYIRQVWPER
jgi:predicted nucleotidyltransferase component of viral defense system